MTIFPVFQTLGGTIFVSVAQSIFTNRLISRLLSLSSSYNDSEIISVGADDLRSHFSGIQLRDILDAYMFGLKATWILGIACACAAFLTSFGTKVHNIRQPTTPSAVGDGRRADGESQTAGNAGETDKKIGVCIDSA